MLFTAYGSINIKNKKWEQDFSPIDEMGITYVDTMYSKAYLRHLFAAKEMLGKQIASIHNLGFYVWLTREARKHILAGDFAEWKDKMVKQMDKQILNNLKILDWYILKRYLLTFFFTLLILIPIAVAIDVAEKVDKFLRHPNLGLLEILNDYYKNFIIYYANTFMPLAVFIAVIFFTSKLANNTEIVAYGNAKISFTRFLRPYLIGATLVTILALVMNHFVVPNSSKVRKKFERDYINSKRSASKDRF